LIDRIEVKEDPAYTRVAREKLPCRIEIRTRGGGVKTASVDYPRGHPLNPMSDEEVNAKFRGVAHRVLPEKSAGRLLEALWRIETAPNLDAVFEAARLEG
jgi:2-methylcitrate dehydratase